MQPNQDWPKMGEETPLQKMQKALQDGRDLRTPEQLRWNLFTQVFDTLAQAAGLSHKDFFVRRDGGSSRIFKDELNVGGESCVSMFLGGEEVHLFSVTQRTNGLWKVSFRNIISENANLFDVMMVLLKENRVANLLDRKVQEKAREARSTRILAWSLVFVVGVFVLMMILWITGVL